MGPWRLLGSGRPASTTASRHISAILAVGVWCFGTWPRKLIQSPTQVCCLDDQAERRVSHGRLHIRGLLPGETTGEAQGAYEEATLVSRGSSCCLLG